MQCPYLVFPITLTLVKRANGIVIGCFSSPGSHLLGEGGKSRNMCVWGQIGMIEKEASSERKAYVSWNINELGGRE